LGKEFSGYRIGPGTLLAVEFLERGTQNSGVRIQEPGNNRVGGSACFLAKGSLFFN
jgi:hypothetical protein